MVLFQFCSQRTFSLKTEFWVVGSFLSALYNSCAGSFQTPWFLVRNLQSSELLFILGNAPLFLAASTMLPFICSFPQSDNVYRHVFPWFNLFEVCFVSWIFRLMPFTKFAQCSVLFFKYFHTILFPFLLEPWHKLDSIICSQSSVIFFIFLSCVPIGCFQLF